MLRAKGIHYCLVILAAILSACTTTPTPKELPTPSYVITAPEATPLGKQVATLRPRTVNARQSGLFLLGQGVEAFSARVGLAQRAPDIGTGRRETPLTSGSEASLHAKAFVIDQRTVLIGSMNFDPRSAWYNSELGILVESPELAAQVVQAFDRVTSSDRVWKMALDENGLAWISTDVKDASTLRGEPASFWRRGQVELLGPLAPEGYM